MTRILGIILAIALAAVAGIVASRSILPHGPAGGLYEGARASRGLAISIGPNDFRVEAVARRMEDGTTAVGDGMGIRRDGRPIAAGNSQETAAFMPGRYGAGYSTVAVPVSGVKAVRLSLSIPPRGAGTASR